MERARGLDVREGDPMNTPPGFLHIPISALERRLYELPEQGKTLEVCGDPPDWMFERWKITRIAPSTLKKPPVERVLPLWTLSPALTTLLSTTSSLIGETCIDIGAGCGRDAVDLALLGGTVTAVERLQSLCERIKELAARYDVTIDILQGNLRTTLSEDLRRRGFKANIVLLSRFPYTREIYTFVGTLVNPGGYLVLSQYHTSTSDKPSSPKMTHCISEELIFDLLHKGPCQGCKTSGVSGKCLRRRNCGLGPRFSILKIAYSETHDGLLILTAILHADPSDTQ
ncbi:Methyltransferase domain-containing protein [Giardia muris]|uniref:Methyltransferase domain-containing protein n=1 Tax=Giardia muris TaxID=5742 RepID=A0A4Z1SUS4_GIAMU|nr:Methyltransferase domain-containing protein [Giardia muris]|eukprot:TNJ29642.1 Methyltransferase domain-containing protein [Giardia muris]